MQGLGEAADVIERGLRDSLHFLEVGVDGRIGWKIFSGAADEGADGCEYLPEFVVEFAGDMAEGGFLGGD